MNFQMPILLSMTWGLSTWLPLTVLSGLGQASQSTRRWRQVPSRYILLIRLNFILVLNWQQFVSWRFYFIYESSLLINLFIFSNTSPCSLLVILWINALYRSDWFLDSEDLFFSFLFGMFYLFISTTFDLYICVCIRLLLVEFKC